VKRPPERAIESEVHVNEPPSEKDDESGGYPSYVAVATTVAFFSFVVIYSLAGEPAAGLVFWGVFVGLVLLLPLLSMWSTRSRRTKQKDIQIAATLAADLAVRRAREEMSRGA
jgi:Flp pilus assembly protein TadB